MSDTTTPKRNEAVAYRVHVPDEPELGHWYEDVGETKPEFVTTETHDPLYSQATVDALERELELAHGWTGDPHLSGKTALANAHAVSDVLREQIAALQGEVSRLRAIIDTPQSNDFLRAVSTEAEHQRQRWGSDHDAGKTPADWFWLVGYLAGKALHAHAAGNVEKAEHHIITTAAALANWHLSMFGGTDMRPGIDGEAALNLEPPTDGR